MMLPFERRIGHDIKEGATTFIAKQRRLIPVFCPFDTHNIHRGVDGGTHQYGMAGSDQQCRYHVRHVTPHEVICAFARFGALCIGRILVHVDIVYHQKLASRILPSELFNKTDHFGFAPMTTHGGHIVINFCVAQRAAKVGIPGKKECVEQGRG